ncbi:MAG: efflux RND transporter periplasmic adaptor subunit [Wenzhouxiangellaceae bacterium]
MTALLLAGCGGDQEAAGTALPPVVLVATPAPVTLDSARMSGTVRARFETPQAFQVPGRILKRLVDAGRRVEAGELLLELDPREYEQQRRVAEADLEAAKAELATAEAETRRQRELLERKFISPQVFEQVQLAERSARERVDAARARLEQAELRLEYTRLHADRTGVLMEVRAEPGQVVAAGQVVAVLAEDALKEIEVSLPEQVGVPEQGVVLLDGVVELPLTLREVAGAADPVTRTWTARYALASADPGLRLGSVVRVRLHTAAVTLLEVPVGAINERGQGPQLWVIEDGRVHPVPVALVTMNDESAHIVADLPPDAQIVAAGTHLLEPGMAVRPRRQPRP